MNPFKFNRLRTIEIFPVNTLYVTVDTEATSVTSGICPKIWKLLPCEGFILLNIANTVPATATDAFLVNIDTCLTLNQVKPCPIPAYITCNPYDSYTPFYGYANGYVNGGCCA